MKSLYYHTFVILLVVVTLAFFRILWPFYPAIFWGTVLAILFAPLHRALSRRMRRHPNLAALSTLLLCLLMVIVPLIMITVSLVREVAAYYKKIQQGQIDPGLFLQRVLDAMPNSVHKALEVLGLSDISSLQDRLSAGAMTASKFMAGQALSLGQNTFQFLVGLGIMLYLLFFLFRDGAKLSLHIKRVIPMSEDHLQNITRKFAVVVRATVKGNVVIAITQGVLGGLIFWILGIEGALLWGVVMAFLSLLPALGPALIWIPVAAYLLATGEFAQAIILIVYGIVVIGLVDNVLRPLLVGKDTKIPDYIVLISTIGGLSVFGLNGFVIGPLIAALFIAVWDLFPAAAQMREE